MRLTSVLEVLDRRSELEEGEGRDERDGHVREQPGVLVVGHSVEAGHGPLDDDLHLVHERGRVLLGRLIVRLLGLCERGSVELSNLLLDDSHLGRVAPLLSPVSTSHSLGRSGTNSLENELGRVCAEGMT